MLPFNGASIENKSEEANYGQECVDLYTQAELDFAGRMIRAIVSDMPNAVELLKKHPSLSSELDRYLIEPIKPKQGFLLIELTNDGGPYVLFEDNITTPVAPEYWPPSTEDKPAYFVAEAIMPFAVFVDDTEPRVGYRLFAPQDEGPGIFKKQMLEIDAIRGRGAKIPNIQVHSMTKASFYENHGAKGFHAIDAAGWDDIRTLRAVGGNVFRIMGGRFTDIAKEQGNSLR